MYNSHIGARKAMKKGGKFPWQPQHEVLEGGYTKICTCLLESLLLRKEKENATSSSGATTKIFMPDSDLPSLSLAMICGHRHTAGTDATSFLCCLSGFLLCLEVV